MLRKFIALTGAAALLICSGLHRCCDVEIGGQVIVRGCSVPAVRYAEQTARLAAEEILPGEAELPGLTRHYYLSLFPGAETCPELTDAILRATPGIAVRSAVYIGSTRLGTVRDSAEFIERLKSYILSTMPTWAVCGSLSQAVDIRPQYCRSGIDASFDDMIQLVTGRAPVLFSDGKEHISAV